MKTVEIDNAAESFRALKVAESELAQADAAINAFRRQHYTTINGKVQLVSGNIGERNALDREAFRLCRARDVALAEFQAALKCWIQLNGNGGNKNARQQSVS